MTPLYLTTEERLHVLAALQDRAAQVGELASLRDGTKAYRERLRQRALVYQRLAEAFAGHRQVILNKPY